jgi:hypothetical protein
MTLFIDPTHIICDQFTALEEPLPHWLEQKDYWEQYTKAFFRSNGLDYSSADSNVETWLSAPDRAPFAAMADALLDRLRNRVDLSRIDFVLLAHWLPDLHLGTSVTNFVMHKLQLDGSFGFAISDHGLSAPFFALDCMCKYLRDGRSRGLLLTMDQKHLLYRSDIVDRYQPANSACVISIDTTVTEGLLYAGYARAPLPGQSLDNTFRTLTEKLALRFQDITLIAEPFLLDLLSNHHKALAATAAVDPRLLCSGPFARLSELAEPGGTYLLLTRDSACLTGVAFHWGRVV